MRYKKGFWMKMIPMFVLVAATIFLSVMIYLQMMEAEKERCWEKLESATNNTAGKIQVRIDDNVNFLKAVSDSYILTHDIHNVEAVGNYLGSVMEMTIFDRIDVILPDNSLITQDGTISTRSGSQSYEALVEKGTHISGRRTSSFNGKEVICCATPIEEQGEILGLLVGTIHCENLSKLFEVTTYDGNAQIFLIDCADGSYIIDNWHEKLGNIHELGKRKSAYGNDVIDMASAIVKQEKVRYAYISETNGMPSYQYSTPVEGHNWTLCVSVQEDVAFVHVKQLKQLLYNVGMIESLLVFGYILWNIVLGRIAYKNEEKAKRFEYEKVQNEARTRFIANMSHDIRTPLNGIVGMLRIIENHRRDEKKVDECLRKISISTQYLSTLASDMLDINEIEHNKLVLQEDAINLKVLAEELGVMLEPRAQESGVEYHMDISGVKNVHVIGSEVHLKRILVNLATNAIKYSKEAGRNVWISIQEEEISFDVTSRIYRFIVQDNGIGMSEEFQRNMYQAFEQEKISARSTYQGYGLGLTIVNFLVQKMGGKIDLESQKGVGSTFTVSIPLKPDTEWEQHAQQDNTVADLSGVKLLVVEDNAFNLEIAESLLQDAGAKVAAAVNGKMAVDMFAASEPGTYDLILMDIMMPMMDGCEATKAIRSLERPDAKSIPIVAMTASTFAEEIKRCKDAGMNAHLSKPLEVEKLMAEIAKYGKRH